MAASTLARSCGPASPALQARPRAVGRAPRCHRGLAVTASAAGAGAADGHPWGHPSLGPWERLQLARRKLEVAVAEEDYRLAAEAKREAEALHARLPANLALMAALLERLEEPGGLPEEEAVAALRQLGDLGEWAAAPALAAALHEGEPVAAAAEEACWQLFLRCPTEELQQMMSEGVVLMRRPEQWDAAAALFDDMVRRAPTFAEAYNKRATVAYLQQRYHDAIQDCKTALAMNPWHFKAAAGLGLCCAAVGDAAGAVAGYQHALALNPRMRHLRTHIRMLQEQQAERRQERAAE